MKVVYALPREFPRGCQAEHDTYKPPLSLPADQIAGSSHFLIPYQLCGAMGRQWGALT